MQFLPFIIFAEYVKFYLSNSNKNNPIVYNRFIAEPSLIKKEDSTLFSIKDLKQWLKSIIKKNPQWKWPFFEQRNLPLPYYVPTSISDTTLVFESRFESGNLLIAAKISDNEYKLLLQNDSLTKRNTQCFLLISFRVLFQSFKHA